MRYGGKPCYVLALERYHKSVGRLGLADGGSYECSLFQEAASWRGAQYWRTLQCLADGNVSQTWRHDRLFTARRPRWDTLLYTVYEELWLQLAGEPGWAALQEKFVTDAWRLYGMSRPVLSKANARKASCFAKRPARAIVFDATEAPWLKGSGPLAVEILSDSQLVTTCLAGTSRVSGTYSPRIGTIQNEF